MDSLSAPSNFLVQCFRNSDSKDLGLRDLGMRFRHISEFRDIVYKCHIPQTPKGLGVEDLGKEFSRISHRYLNVIST